MRIEPQEPGALVPAMMAKAREFLAAAQREAGEEEWFRAADGAYYAVFHAMTAALASQGLSYAKHAGVMGFFRLQFIKTGVFPESFSEAIKRLSEQREIGDYSYQLQVDGDEVRRGLADAEAIVAAIATYLTEAGLLPH